MCVCSAGRIMCQRETTEADTGRWEKRCAESETKGFDGENRGRGGWRGASSGEGLYLIVLILSSVGSVCHAPALLTSSDNGKNSIKLIN